MKAGDKVYRVVPNLADDGHLNEWCLQARGIKTVSRKLIQLTHQFTGLGGVRFVPKMLGLWFFASEREAFQNFAARQREDIESLKRKTVKAKRAAAWAEEMTEYSKEPT